MTKAMKNHVAIFRNKLRQEPDDYEKEFSCCNCDAYVTHLVKLPHSHQLYCKGCLIKSIEVLDQALQGDFEKNFQESRGKSTQLAMEQADKRRVFK